MLTDLQPPGAEPITLAETKLFLRVDHDDEDGLINTLIQSARERLEAYLNTAMITRPLRVTSGAVCGTFALPRWPVTSVETVRADDTVVLDIRAELRRRPATLEIHAHNHVEIDFTAGYGPAPSDVPAPLRQALLLLVAHAYEHRVDAPTSMPLMVDALTLPYRVVSL